MMPALTPLQRRNCLLLPVISVVLAHHEPQYKRRQSGMPVRHVGEHRQKEQAREHELEFGLDDPVAVTPEEPARDSRQPENQGQRNAKEAADVTGSPAAGGYARRMHLTEDQEQ